MDTTLMSSALATRMNRSHSASPASPSGNVTVMWFSKRPHSGCAASYSMTRRCCSTATVAPASLPASPDRATRPRNAAETLETELLTSATTLFAASAAMPVTAAIGPARLMLPERAAARSVFSISAYMRSYARPRYARQRYGRASSADVMPSPQSAAVLLRAAAFDPARRSTPSADRRPVGCNAAASGQMALMSTASRTNRSSRDPARSGRSSGAHTRPTLMCSKRRVSPALTARAT
mmetsp:Transcript_497/g.1842  ORF Transcript_497/g.1842 Transcript_497/m.1842 type:complete len:237 (-) Transcript_497:189-899(-)